MVFKVYCSPGTMLLAFVSISLDPHSSTCYHLFCPDKNLDGSVVFSSYLNKISSSFISPPFLWMGFPKV